MPYTANRLRCSLFLQVSMLTEPTLRNLSLKAILLVLLMALAPLGICRSTVPIQELPQSFVEGVRYLGKGEFEVSLAAANASASRRPARFFDGKDKLSFVIQADSLDGTLIESSSTDSASSRTDFKLSGTAFVNLVISKATSRDKILLSCAFLPADVHRARDTYQLIYFQVDGS